MVKATTMCEMKEKDKRENWLGGSWEKRCVFLRDIWGKHGSKCLAIKGVKGGCPFLCNGISKRGR
jgi:hypothetical protein